MQDRGFAILNIAENRLLKRQLKNHWTHRSGNTPGRPRVSKQVRLLILDIKSHKPFYGCLRIARELPKLAIDVSSETIRRMLRNGYKNGDIKPTGSRKRFLKLHTRSIKQFGITTTPVSGNQQSMPQQNTDAKAGQKSQ